MVTIRPPTPTEFEIARRILRDARLDPTPPLYYEHTLIALADDKVVGVGQIKHHADCQELGSLVVLPAYRAQGIAAQLIAALEAQAERPLYLLCVDSMRDYYVRFGYRVIGVWEAPMRLRLKLIPAQIARLFGMHTWVMRKD